MNIYRSGHSPLALMYRALRKFKLFFLFDKGSADIQNLYPKKFWSRNFVWSKIFEFPKYLSLKRFGPKKCGLQKLRPPKIGSKKLGQKVLGIKDSLVQKMPPKIGSKKFGQNGSVTADIFLIWTNVARTYVALTNVTITAGIC